MNLTKLPIFQFADKSLMLLQTQWAQILNPVTKLASSFNAYAPTQHVFPPGQSGIYNTPANAFYLNVIMASGSSKTTFGANLFTCNANNAGAILPNNSSVYGFFSPLGYLDAIITKPDASYAYAVGAGSSAYILVREYYQ